MKLDSDGDFMWAKSFAGTSDEFIHDATVDSDGTSYIVGYFQESIDFDPSDEVNELNSAGYIDGFILILDSNGDLITAGTFNSPGLIRAYAINIDADKNIYCGGTFLNLADLDPSEDVFEKYTSTSNSFLVKLGAINLNSNEYTLNSDIIVYPNPTTDILNIKSLDKISKIKIINSTGKEVYKNEKIENQIDLSFLSAGLYCVNITFETGKEISKNIIVK